MSLEELSDKMKKLACYAVPSDIYNEEKAKEYYKVQKAYQIERKRAQAELDAKANKVVHSNHKTFVNGYGDATRREITTLTYERAMKRQSKRFLWR